MVLWNFNTFFLCVSFCCPPCPPWIASLYLLLYLQPVWLLTSVVMPCLILFHYPFFHINNFQSYLSQINVHIYLSIVLFLSNMTWNHPPKCRVHKELHSAVSLCAQALAQSQAQPPPSQSQAEPYLLDSLWHFSLLSPRKLHTAKHTKQEMLRKSVRDGSEQESLTPGSRPDWGLLGTQLHSRTWTAGLQAKLCWHYPLSSACHSPSPPLHPQSVETLSSTKLKPVPGDHWIRCW